MGRIGPASVTKSRVNRGLTLIEVIITVALIALMTGGLIYGSGLLGSSQQRAAASLDELLFTLIVLGDDRAIERVHVAGA